ncbi:long-chain fatty acid--CoA ligase [Salicibibacter cibarius]|uniref:Long-chain fatty acid--CoA ligase n=1 Tax=Salicibibacter cibarius TaxID=2743000 RepID=A0A7T7CCD5_9BACI|nr:long-chain fatty acid--CoA ligase [Salicibibacter cibarius]QQK76833.1 long-chain fatty acid--CoA ligase [Salicibibacter cibarius]
MMNTQLLVAPMLERAETYFPKKEVVSRTLDTTHRLTYRDIGKRTRALASVLEKFGVQRGERVGSFAWNHHRHLEAYFGVPGMGGIIHMINIRLPEEHLVHVINHAEDRVLLIDEDLLPLIERVKDKLTSVHTFVVMTDKDELPETSLAPIYSYEALIRDGDETYEFLQDIDENEPAAMCYTSATTGLPKGVVYSHRGIALHTLSLGLADSAAASEDDVSMPVVPMFHVNAWGMPFSSTWFGSKQVLPGPNFTPKLIAELIQSEGVTITAGVPTIWLGLLQVLEQENYDMSSLRAVLCGGSAAPKGMIEKFEKEYNIPFVHAYGMTETTPLVTLSRLKSHQQELPEAERMDVRSTQGMAVPGIDIKAINENGDIKWDGEDMGELLIRGPWIADEYHNDNRSEEAFQDGWLYTGDVVTIDEEGSINIVDRTKDLIKSGGEWISSVELENAIMAHDAVQEAAVVAVADPKWQERPVACVVVKDGDKVSISKDDINDFLRPQFAKWWLPDDVLFMDEIPKTSVGKFLKRALRDKVQQ